MKKGEFKSALIGERFGRLTVFFAKGRSRKCRCDCGNEITVGRASALTSGNTTSCGCLRNELTRTRFKKHGACRTPIYAVWSGMIQRCENHKNKKFDRYGGRGIFVCKEWRESFDVFFRDMGNPPNGCSLDRIDNDGPYSPSNCRWANHKTQSRNKGNNRIITLQGRSLTVSEWAEERGISQRTILTRLRIGWDGSRAVFAEVSHEL